MNKTIVGLLVVVVTVSAQAAPFTTLAGNSAYEGKTGLKKLTTGIDANFAIAESRIGAVEAAGVGGTLATANIIVGDATSNATAVAVTGAVSIDTNGATTVDGEYITNDTIDDDSIDFADVTGADLTLTDCGAITSSARVQGATLGIGATLTFQLTGTQLECVVSGVTNVLDADVTTP
jgi:hypothetical protein